MTKRKEHQSNEKNKLLIPKVDIVFQSLFNKNNPEITKAFAEVLLEEKIENMKINEDKELIRNRPNDKLGILDLELDINNREKVDVEVQLIKRDDFIERLLYYITRLYWSGIKKGKKYKTAKRAVLIAIVDFDIEELKDIKEMETKWKLIETKNREKILTELIEIDIIKIRKAKKEYEKDRNNKKAQWMLFLDNPNSKEVEEIMKKNKEIEKCVITVKKLTEDEKMERLEFLREKAIMDEDGIRSQGIKDGARNKSIEIAKKLLEFGMEEEKVKEITKLNEQEIKKLRK